MRVHRYRATRPGRRHRRTPVLVAVLGVAVLVIAGLVGVNLSGLGGPVLRQSESPSPSVTASTEPTSSAQPTGSTEPTGGAPEESGPAQQALATLEVKGRGPKTGYDRDLFRWNGYDFDRNGCDQRNDILRRDMTDPEVKPGTNGCRIEAGWLQDRYGGEAIRLTRDKVDIDHVVALSNAWQMGAAQWDEQTRREFANDPLNLVATTQRLNRQKGDGDAATWLPPKNRCDYVARQTAVKAAYGLAVTRAERDAIARILDTCPGQPLPTGDEPAPQQSVSTSPTPS